MTVTVRTASADDEAAITALWGACGLVTSYNDPAEDFHFAISGACSDVLVGVDDAGRIKGSVMVGHDGHRGWLYYVSSDPGSRGAGIGRLMVRAAEDWLGRRGVRKVQLLIRETNSNVISFYERLGFETAPRVIMGRWLDSQP